MSVDLLSNMISAFKNASLAGRSSIEIPYSKSCEEVAKVLKSRGFISEVKVFKVEKKNFKGLHLDILKADNQPVISQARRISKPGRKIYRGHDRLYVLQGGR